MLLNHTLRTVRPFQRMILRSFWTAGAACLLWVGAARAQVQDHAAHERGRLWDVVWTDGFIGDKGAWDFTSFLPKGLFPGFSGYAHPCCNEFAAINTFANANNHNFRSGVWIVAQDLNVPGLAPTFTPTPADYEFYASGAQGDTRGVLTARAPFELRKNYLEDPDDFNPLLPEEMIVAEWDTNVGITITRRTYVWSYPGYRDMILYDYLFENTGQMVSIQSNQLVPNVQDFQQTLEEVFFVFHSAISVDTKSQINFHGDDLPAVAAGAFGWKPPYHDFYGLSDDRTLAYSYNFNGGIAPPPFDTYEIKQGEPWVQRFGIDNQTPELMSPAAFGWVMLHADPNAEGRTGPEPDVLRIDTHKGGQFNGRDLDLEFFKPNDRSPQEYYQFATTPTLQEQLGNTGNRHNIYTFSYGPYTLAPGDSVRFVLAEIAGVMDYNDIIRGDPEGHFPDSSIAAIERNADLARQAVAWGLGATVNGIPLAADAPEPPPAPAVDAVNASVGTEQAAIAVTWDQIAETTTIEDGSGGIFYDGLADLDGYRVYRTVDFQFVSENEDPVLRGAAWDLLVDIPKADFDQFFDAELQRYRFADETVQFGRRYGYYVSAYNSDPGPWTSANGTVVNNLPELASGDTETYGEEEMQTQYNRTPPAAALAGPVTSFDIYAVPNPYVFGDANRSFGVNDPFRIEFRNLPERATIRIYTVSGDLIRTIRHGPDTRGNLFGTAVWDQKSDSGLLVAPGLYIYHIDSETEGLDDALVEKLMIIR